MENNKMEDDALTLLARIDERVKNLDSKIDSHMTTLEKHLKEDEAFQEKMNKKILWLTCAIIFLGTTIGGADLIIKIIQGGL